jgi:hypothetical protein
MASASGSPLQPVQRNEIARRLVVSSSPQARRAPGTATSFVSLPSAMAAAVRALAACVALWCSPGHPWGWHLRALAEIVIVFS